MSEARVSKIVMRMLWGALVSVAAAFAFLPAPSSADWRASAFFAAFGFLGSALSYRQSQATSGSIGFLPWLSAALVSPTAAAPISVFVSSFAADLVHRRELRKVVFNAAQHTFALSVGLGLYVMLGGRALGSESPNLVAFAALTLSYFTLNKLAVSTVVAASTGRSTKTLWRRSMRESIGNDVLSVPLVLIIGIAFARLGPAWSAVLALPVLGIRRMYQSVFALQKVNEELLQLMVASIEARDPYTSGHSVRVARYSRVISKAAGLTGKLAERAEVAALLHDVGKIHEEFAVILRKPGALTEEEFSIMKTHPEKSAVLVAKVSQFQDLVGAVRAHHEAWDGTGYPAQHSGEAIPLAARVITIADTIDAMTTDRPYRRALTADEVKVEIASESGRQFDPSICARLLEPKLWAELTREIEHAQVENPPLPLSEEYIDEGRTGEFRRLASNVATTP